MRLKSFLCCSSLLVLLALPALAAEPLAPRGEVSVKGGTDRSLLTTEFWAPLAQQSDRVLYGDIRLMGDNDDNREGNLGLGYRQIKNDAVLGVHGWIDRRRTRHNSTFHQLTFGVERFGHIVDARANIYIPLNQGRNVATPNTGSTSPYLSGSGIYYDTNGLLSETPQYGVDGELGYRLPIFQKQIDAIRVYGGGYYFFRDNTVEVPGMRFRTEAQINKIVSIGARVQYDKPRGTQGFLDATLKFPFSAKRLYQESGIRSRLDESPERDVDIVTNAKQIDTGLKKPVINTTSGTQQRILYVDNSKADNGDGSYEKPFNTLKSAEAALQANDILYINRGDGTTSNMNQGIVIDKPNIQLIGSGSPLTYGGYTLLNAGAAPVITNTQASTNTFTGNAVLATAGNIVISGLTLNGATRAGINVRLDGRSADYVTVQNVTLSNNAIIGLSIKPTTNGSIGEVLFANNTITGNGVSIAAGGTYIGVESGGTINNISVLNNIATGNFAQGIGVDANGGRINNVLVQGNRASGNTASGLNINSQNGGSINNLTVIDNISNSNTSNGLYIAAVSGGSIRATSVSNNTTNQNTATGVTLYSSDANSLIGPSTFTNMTSNNNGVNGIAMRNISGGVMGQITLRNATANNNAQSGVSMQINSTTGITGIQVSDITASGNTAYGVSLLNTTGAIINATSLQRLTLNSNTSGGLLLSASATIANATISDISANNNGGRGVSVTTGASTGVINQVSTTNITATGNNSSGIAFSAYSGQINNITASNIVSNNNITGLYILADTAGSINNAMVSGITANNNSQFGISAYLTSVGGSLNNVSIANSSTLNNTQIGVNLQNDKTNGVYAVDLGGGTMNSAGQNRSFNNGISDLRVLFTTAAAVSAKNNWWGNVAGLQPGRVSISAGSSVNSTAFLTTDPRP